MHLGLLVVLDQQVGLADGVVGRRQLLAVDGDVLLDVRFLLGRGGAVEQVFLGHGQHAARPAGRVVDGDVPVRDGDVEQFDHQPDHFARGEVFSGLLAALFREAPQDLLVDVAHLQRRQLVRAELQFLVLVQDRSEAVVLHRLADGGPVVEMLDDVVDVLREAVDVGAEVLLEQRVVFLVDLPQRPVRLVGERGRAGLQALHQLREFLFGKLGALRQDLGRLVLTPLDEHALEAAYHDDGQDDVLVLVGLELAAQPFGRLPDVTGEIVEFGLVQGKGHCFASPIFCSHAAGRATYAPSTIGSVKEENIVSS